MIYFKELIETKQIKTTIQYFCKVITFLSLLLISCRGLHASSLAIEIVPSCEEDMHYQFLSPQEQVDPMRSGWDRAWSIFYQDVIKKGGDLNFTDLSDVPKKRHKLLRLMPWTQLKASTDLIIAWGMPHFIHSRKFFNLPKRKMILFLIEPPTVIEHQYQEKVKESFRKIFTWNDDLVDNKTFFKFYYPVLKPAIDEPVSFSNKSLVCMVVANKHSSHPDELYSKRNQIIQSLDHRPDFHLYGHGWDSEYFKSYRGSVPDKIETMKHYRFTFCLENMGNVRGYITEKIFDAFSALTVPIYEGASNIADEIPSSCFIDLRTFASIDALMQFLESMPQEQYEQYLFNIQKFLLSEQAQKFSTEAFTQLLKDEILKDY
ncbi:MAG: hypothetical protein K9M07_00125 [Simkaniaceae bacterium]|nr:hypothetical protein [Simkaniaceae bacterium]